MPGPLVPIVISTASGVLAALGAKKGHKGLKKLKRAKRLAAAANSRQAQAEERLETRRAEVEGRADLYGRHILEVQDGTFGALVELLEALRKRVRIDGIELPEGVDVSVGTIASYKRHALAAGDVLRAAGTATSAAAAAGGSTFSAVGLLGTASTGAKIAGLSGAAAKSATLAWLGGGPLAAGGGGMFVGKMVLGGVVAGPAILMSGLALAKHGEKALTKATKFDADVSVRVAKLDSQCSFLAKVVTRIDELDGLVKGLDDLLRRAMDAIDVERFDRDDDDDLAKLSIVLVLAKALAETLRTPILTAKGNLTRRSKNILAEHRPLVA